MSDESWPVIYNENLLFYADLIHCWLDKLDADETTLEEIAKSNYLPIESVTHAVSCAYYDEGLVDKAQAIIEDRISTHPDPRLHTQLLRCLMASAKDEKERCHKEALDWAKLHIKRHESFTDTDFPDRDPDKRLCLGFLCTYPQTSPIRQGMLPLLKRINRDHFRIVFFNIRIPGDKLIEESVDNSVNVLEPTTDNIVDAIRGKQIDLLFDLNGHLRIDNPIEVLAKRPAPVQISWWNSSGTCGINSMQYLMVGGYAIPKADEQYFVEKIHRFPSGASGTFQLPEDPPVSPLPNLQGSPFTFGSFHSLFKLNDEVLHSWATILQRVPGANLLIKAQDINSQRVLHRIAKIFSAHDINLNRLYFEGLTAFHDMMQKYNHIDLSLNPFPYGGGTTTLNALWQGVPSVSLVGNSMQSRGAPAIIDHVGLKQFIAKSPQEYIEKAVYFASNPDKLAEIRATMRDRLKKSAYFNPDLFVTDFEKGCRAIWHDWLNHSEIQHAA